MKYVTLEKIIRDLNLEVVFSSTDIEDVKIASSEIGRPGLQMAGYFEKFAPERIQIIGNSEWWFYDELDDISRYDSIDKLLTYPLPALILSRNLPAFPELIELAKKHNRTILRTDMATTRLINKIINHVDYLLAPETTVHGVLVEVFGLGVLITGKSGVGKSETALDLVIRGHRLVADDTIDIKRVEDELRGEAPELTRHFMEIRGLGILNIERLYGVSSVKPGDYIDLVVELELWDKDKEYDRVGLDEHYTDILGVKLSTVVVPVRPGRNIAMIIEVAARNFRQKKLGYNAAFELNEKIKTVIENRARESKKR